MKRFVFVLGCLFLMPCPLAQAQSKSRLLQHFEAALLAIDTPPPPSFWTRHGEEGMLALFEIASDPRRPLPLRRRAARALAHFRSESARQALRALLDASDEVLARFVLRALVEVEHERAVPLLRTIIESGKPFLRRAAIEDLLYLFRITPAKDHLRALLRDLAIPHADPALRIQIEKALASRPTHAAPRE
ncbi:MAG: HEAT repeat domain-containing protein [Sandaracinaceae bacterium]|nr:HEAT repeat domain-containing protein [Sandaracinaceae bacterium]